MIDSGKTLWEIARELDMEYSALVAMLEQMVRMGYLTHGTQSNLARCRTCPLNSACSERNYRVYFLTDKGRRLISR